MNEQNSKPKESNYNNLLLVFIIGIVAIFIISLIFASTNEKSENKSSNNNVQKFSDSTATLMVNDINKRNGKAEPIKIDSVEFKKLRKTFRREKEEFSENRYFYLPSNYPHYRNTNYMGFYFGGTKEKANDLHFIIQYSADDWLFIEYIKFDFDGKFDEYGPLNFETNVSNGVQEWSDESVDYSSQLVQYFKKAKSVKYRLEGKQFYRDYKMSPEKLKKIQNTIKLYEFMK